jgi:hypothetical protein
MKPTSGERRDYHGRCKNAPAPTIAYASDDLQPVICRHVDLTFLHCRLGEDSLGHKRQDAAHAGCRRLSHDDYIFFGWVMPSQLPNESRRNPNVGVTG